MWLLLSLALASDPTAYADGQRALDLRRAELAGTPRSDAVRQEARAALLASVDDALIPPWIGTPWDFYGTSQIPGRGQIACGYFVSTLLRDTGLRVERVRLAQQASEYIVRTFSEPPNVQRFRGGDEGAVVKAVLAEPEGLYVVGLDFHVGLLVRRGDAVRFCHATWVDRSGVMCEDPLQSPAFVSEYHVFGPVLEDRVLDAWLDGTELPTVTR